MSQQDTFHKLKDNICTGMKFVHKYRQMGRPELNWYCTIDKIDAENNNLKVTITSYDTGYSHPEDWDMRITVNGLAQGEYIECT